MAPGRIETNGEDLSFLGQPQPGDASQTLPQQPVRDSTMREGGPSHLNGHVRNGGGSMHDGEPPHLNGRIQNGEPPHLNGRTQNGEPPRLNGHVRNGHGSHPESTSDGSTTPLNGFATPLSTNGSLNGDAKPLAGMPIAVIGISVRAGSASTPDEFFEMLSRGRSAFSSEIPPERFNNASFYHPNAGKLGCINTNGACFIQQDITKFDAPFFSITELEATSMDPQQRLLLECAFEALDNAGIPKHKTVGKDIGVFIGAGSPEYEFDLFRDSDTMPMFQATGKSNASSYQPIDLTFQRKPPGHAIQQNQPFL